MSDCKHERKKFIGRESDHIELNWCIDCGAYERDHVVWEGGYIHTSKGWGHAKFEINSTKEIEALKAEKEKVIRLLFESSEDYENDEYELFKCDLNKLLKRLEQLGLTARRANED